MKFHILREKLAFLTERSGRVSGGNWPFSTAVRNKLGIILWTVETTVEGMVQRYTRNGE